MRSVKLVVIVNEGDVPKNNEEEVDSGAERRCGKRAASHRALVAPCNDDNDGDGEKDEDRNDDDSGSDEEDG